MNQRTKCVWPRLAAKARCFWPTELHELIIVIYFTINRASLSLDMLIMYSPVNFIIINYHRFAQTHIRIYTMLLWLNIELHCEREKLALRELFSA